jgi:outer membrane protein assembly factor BamB
VRGSQLDLCSDELALLQVFDSAPGRIAAAWTMSSDLVLATTDPARVTRLSRGSDERWHQRWGSKLPCSPASIAPCGDDALVFLSDGTVLRVDRDGDRVWKTALPLWTRSAPSVVNIHGEIIVVAAARGDAPLTAIGLSTGNVLWQNAGAGQIVADTLLSADGSHLLSATRDTAFNLLRISDGEIVDRHRDFVRPLVGAAHFMPASSVLVLTEYGSGGRVALYDYAHKRILWSEPAGDSGALAGPILYGDVIVVQDVAGTIRAWRWEDWR